MSAAGERAEAAGVARAAGAHGGLERCFRCPRCAQAFDPRQACPGCGHEVFRRGSVLDFLADTEREAAARRVEDFYEVRPFPGYVPGDDGPGLVDRSRRSAFLAALDRSVPTSATVLDCGSGTSQLAAFLALCGPRRTIVAIDGCRASLAQADGFRAREHVENLHLARADLFALPIAPRSFEIVISRGVVHHTPDPDRAIRSVAATVAPGGHLVLGFYETAARLAHRLRRRLGALAGRPVWALDPVLRRRDLDLEKKRTWIEDQYRHPLERSLAFPEVLGLLEREGFEWLRSVPPLPAAPGEEGRAFFANLFEPTPRPSRAGLAMRRAGWALAGVNDQDAGLVAVVLRRQ